MHLQRKQEKQEWYVFPSDTQCNRHSPACVCVACVCVVCVCVHVYMWCVAYSVCQQSRRRWVEPQWQTCEEPVGSVVLVNVQSVWEGKLCLQMSSLILHPVLSYLCCSSQEWASLESLSFKQWSQSNFWKPTVGHLRKFHWSLRMVSTLGSLAVC